MLQKKAVIFFCALIVVVTAVLVTQYVLGVSILSDLNMNNRKIVNLAPPTSDSDAATKSYIDSAAPSNFPWSRLTNFPSACSSGQYVSAVGSTLTCSTPSGAWRYLYNNNEYGYASPNVNNFFVGNSGRVLVATDMSLYSSNLSVANSFEIQSAGSGYRAGGTSFYVDSSGHFTLENKVNNRDITITTYSDNLSDIFLNAGGKITLNSGYSGDIILMPGYTVGIGTSYPSHSYKLDVSGSAYFSGNLSVSGTKNFIIDHPLKPRHQLIHSTLEGPEAAVFYRGESQLENGQAIVELPDYFEALTRKEGRTVQLTAKGTDPFCLSYDEIAGGSFRVYGTKPNGEFSWEVKAVRADLPPLEVERENDD